MACFFGCFRVKDDKRSQVHLASDAVQSKKTDPLLTRNKRGSLFLSEEDKESSPCKDTKCHPLRSAPLSEDGDVGELRDEAKFLNACGTLQVIPEIWRVSETVTDSPSCNGETASSRFHSWLPVSSVKKLQMEEKPDQVSSSPVKLCEDLGKELGSPGHKHSSCMWKGELEEKNCTNDSCEFESPNSETKNPIIPIDNINLPSVTPDSVVDIQSKRKSVRFEFESQVESLPSNGESLKPSVVPGSGSKCSPYPTPLKLTDEMQTPGTVYPRSRENLENVKNARIRSQYVYPVLNPVENFSQWKLLKEDCNPYLQVGQQRESLDKCGNSTPQCTPISFSNKSEIIHEEAATVGEHLKLDASLAHWLKPSSPQNEGKENSGVCSISSEKPPKLSGQYSRPILGMVAAHWKEGLSHDTPKWQDGNGIPNSTRKYKEDQRVNFHATPFEERLEKALSEENNVCQRKLISGNPIIFEENEETDTAVSQLHTSAKPESVI